MFSFWKDENSTEGKELDDYEDIISRQSRKKLTIEDIQRARYGSQLDRERHLLRQLIGKYFRFAATAAGLAVAIATLWKAWHGGG